MSDSSSSSPDEGHTQKRPKPSSQQACDKPIEEDDVYDRVPIWRKQILLGRERAVLVEEQLEEAQLNHSLWIDWTKPGAKTFEEYKEVSRGVDYQTDSIDCGRYLPFILCSPIANVLISDEFPTGHVQERWTYQEPPDCVNSDFLELTCNCSQYIDPMYYHYLGEWEHADIIGPIDDKDQGILKAAESASEESKSSIMQKISVENDSLEVNSRTGIESIRRTLEYDCLKKVSGVLTTTGNVAVTRIFDGSVSVDPPCVSFARSTKSHFVIARAAGDNSHKSYPLLAVEPSFPPSDRIVPCLEWHHYLKFGGVEPTSIDRPDDKEIEESLRMMTHLLGCCFTYGLADIVVSDCRSATAIHFDMSSAKRDNVGVIGFRSKTTYCDSVDLPMSLMLAAIGWQQWKRVEDGSYKELWKEVRNAALSLRLTNQEIVDGRQQVPGGSSVAVHIPKLECEFLQDEGSLNRVVRMAREQYEPLFPKASGDTVVVKIMDFANLELYFEENKRDEYNGFSWKEFRKICFDRYGTELECYKRIARFNKKGPRKIHAPKLLDYGVCCIDDDAGGLFDGYYLVLEDLGNNTCSSDNQEGEPEDKVEEELDLLRSIGIDHHDVEWRNIIVRDGQVYIYDFNFAKLDEPEND